VKIRWTPRALADLDGIRRYISGDSPRAASEMVRRVRAAVDVLKTHPLKRDDPAGWKELVSLWLPAPPTSFLTGS
jgi:plasmid stabilization system protein ParE